VLGILSATEIQHPTAIALGNFDGVHLGHQRVIAPMLATDDLLSAVVSFTPHPQEFFSGQPKALLTPPEEKADRLAHFGVHALVQLVFDRTLANLTPDQFVQEILLGQLRAKFISVGTDFRFGRDRTGTACDLRAIAADYGVPVEIVPLCFQDQRRVSSSRIRQALLEGDLNQAEALLGYAYQLNGMVVQGQQLGRQLGFPTANLQLPAQKFLPRRGVYGVWVSSAAGLDRYPGVMNLGIRPTVNGHALLAEVHLLDWSGDLYNQQLRVDLARFLRPEQRFESLEALQRQIAQDCQTARQENRLICGCAGP
jgi:riboflavin kinase/FMN adenylyltransferase